MFRTQALLMIPLAGCVPEGTDDPMRWYAAADEMRGDAYAGCSWQAFDADDRLTETGRFDEAGNIVYHDDCYVDGQPYTRHFQAWNGDELRVVEDQVVSATGEWSTYARTDFGWDDGRLVEASGEGWRETFTTLADGRRTSSELSQDDAEEVVTTWTWTGDADWTAATLVSEGAVYSVQTWTADGRRKSEAWGGTPTTYAWDGDRLASATYGEAQVVHYDYAEGRRNAKIDGDYRVSYHWTCD